MTRPNPQHAAPTRPAAPDAVGTRAPTPAAVDLDEVTRRVYALMLEDLRVEQARHTGGER
ncbi:hypothetical protein LAJ19_19345 (plasmid) [Deinococcus taeanensis]|uniref:hypothetical protein n=1 Tax=Deinococcus taeanensis TaxID=2737050 RepID=UPI001CDC637A|nr:hypothetical protein [Deinococcus taeanensis]UBV44945.1 hypothetical protein LAJ19_19345 [Deinococcus taeanensis]